jgi:hypothetical protein
MEFSPRRSWLYRNRLLAVTFAAATSLTATYLLAQGPLTQYGHKVTVDKGPRALGLVQISPKGKARLTPITIMMDGKFYDAGSYKASPVPMALDFGIVYEGFRTGVTQGVFTITQPGQLNHSWIAEGTWLPAGVKAPETSKKYSTPVIDDKDAPPVLHRRSDSADSGADKKEEKKDEKKPGTGAAPATAAPPAGAPTAPSSTETAKPPATTESAKTPAPDEPIGDPNRPRLRRGKPDATPRQEPFATFDAPTAATPAGATKTGATPQDASAALAEIVTIPAISDAGGPDPRPYNYDVKPMEETIYRNKMFELAATQLHSHATTATKDAASRKQSPTKPAGRSANKLSKPSFDDARLRIFDLSNSNEPILVLSARTHLAPDSSEEPKEITLIARTNLEGEVQKLFFSQTDSRHLDVSPRMELIDAVDADGDGRGELLFRRTSDNGSAYALYRVTSDRLWPLFEGTP